MSKRKNQDLTCPECKGSCMDENFHDCYFCYGTGLASDDDTFERLYRYEDDWRY